MEERGICPLFLPACPTELEHRSSPVLGLGFTYLAPLDLRSSDLDQNETSGFPGSPDWRQQIMGLFRTQSQVPFLHRKLFKHVYIHIYIIYFVFLGNFYTNVTLFRKLILTTSQVSSHSHFDFFLFVVYPQSHVRLFVTLWTIAL